MQWDERLYDKKHDFVARYGENLLKFVNTSAEQSILDLGCGTGDLTRKLAQEKARVVGIDASETMIQRARDKYPDLNFRVMDGLNLDFDQSFDTIFSNAVFHWIKDQDSLLTQMRHALKAEGKLICEFGASGNIASIQKAFELVVTQHGQAYESPFFFPTENEYKTLLEAHGFELEYCVIYDRPTVLKGKDGLKSWMAQFFAGTLSRFSIKEQETILDETEKYTYDKLYIDGEWVADYRRIQVIAKKIIE